MDKIMDKITNQITMLGTGNATISQINTDFLFGYLGESFSRFRQE